jgi:ParB-like chromosome segregation protein Spo0J
MPDTAPARWVPIDSIREWEQNPKRHDDANVHQIATSIKRHGFTAPILVWGSKRRIVAGHGRYRGAQLLLRQDPGALLALDAPAPGQVLIREIEFASESEAAAYALADNRLTEANPMHAPDVAEILRQIEEEVGRVEVAGYSEADIEALLAGAGVAEVPEEAPDTSPQMGALQYRIVVECSDEVEQANLIEQFRAQGVRCQPLIS